MSVVSIPIVNKNYPMGCEDGQEARLIELGKMVDSRARQILDKIAKEDVSLKLINVLRSTSLRLVELNRLGTIFTFAISCVILIKSCKITIGVAPKVYCSETLLRTLSISPFIKFSNKDSV